MILDEIDRLAAEAFEGFVVRKDLANRFRGQYPVPTYVGEFLIGRYCATTNEEEIREGLAIVERQMRQRTVRSGEQELFKSRAREQGSVKLIDLVTARLDARSDSYVAELPSLQIRDVRIDAELVAANERLLTGGFYAEVQLEYDAIVAQEKVDGRLAFPSCGRFSCPKRASLMISAGVAGHLQLSSGNNCSCEVLALSPKG